MKMRSEQGSYIVLPTHRAHDLRDRQWGKGAMGLQTESQHRGEYLDQ